MLHVFLDRAFAHVQTQLEQLASGALLSPKSIIARHLSDQCDRLWGDLRLSRASLSPVLPEEVEKFLMAAKQGLRLHYEERLLPGPHHPCQEQQEEPIGLPADRSFDLPAQDDEGHA
jgi:hypothetical protein